MSIATMPRRRTLACATLAALFMAGCAQVPTAPERAASAPQAAESSTILLVSLSDGSVVQQTVKLDADFCMKSAAAPETTCFKEGPAIYNAEGILVGHEMVRTQVNLYGASETSL
jgi:hypothetical protein